MLATLCQFISTKQVVVGDKESIRNMVSVYQNPPFTLAYPVAMRMTLADTYTLNELLKQAYTLLASTEVTPLATPVAKAHLENLDVD